MDTKKVVEELKEVDALFEALTDAMEADEDCEVADIEGFVIAMMALSRKGMIYAEYFGVPLDMLSSVSKR